MATQGHESVASEAPAEVDGVTSSPEADGAPSASNDVDGEGVASKSLPALKIGMDRPVLAGKGEPACIGQVRDAYHLMQEGHDANALPLLHKALGECPHYSPAHYDLAVIHLRKGGEEAEAVDALEQALRADYLRYATYMLDDDALEPLRASERWAEVRERAAKIRQEWISALDRPGLFVLLGHDDRRAIVIEDWEGYQSREKRLPDLISLVRGQVFFLPSGSNKLLPLSDRTVGGFILDRERRRLHLWRWRRTVGWTESVSSSQSQHDAVVYGIRRGSTVETVSLDELTVVERPRLGKKLARHQIMVCGERIIARPRYDSSYDPPRELLEDSTPLVETAKLPERESCQLYQEQEWFRRVKVARSCQYVTDEEVACEVREDVDHPGRRLVSIVDGVETSRLEGPPILQFEARDDVARLPTTPELVPHVTGLTCEAIENPRLLASPSLDDSYCEVRDVDVQGRYAFVASTRCGVVVWDVADPSAPRQVALIDHDTTVYTAHINGTELLVGDGGGLRSFDVSNPVLEPGFIGSPRLLKRLYVDDSFHGRDVVIKGDTAYVASKAHGVHLVDVSDWANPRYLSKVKGAGFTDLLAFEGEQLLLQQKTWRREAPDRLFDISDPRQPKLVKRRANRWQAPEVREGRFRFVADTKGLAIHDEQQDETPRIGFVALKGHPRAIAVEGRHAFVASSSTWLHVIELCPAPSE